MTVTFYFIHLWMSCLIFCYLTDSGVGYYWNFVSCSRLSFFLFDCQNLNKTMLDMLKCLCLLGYVPFWKDNLLLAICSKLHCILGSVYSLLIVTRESGRILGQSGIEEVTCCFCWGRSAVSLWTDGSGEEPAHPRKWSPGPEYGSAVWTIGAHVYTMWCVEKQIPSKQVFPLMGLSSQHSPSVFHHIRSLQHAYICRGQPQ